MGKVKNLTRIGMIGSHSNLIYLVPKKPRYRLTQYLQWFLIIICLPIFFPTIRPSIIFIDSSFLFFGNEVADDEVADDEVADDEDACVEVKLKSKLKM